jgi:hypothetical protein
MRAIWNLLLNPILFGLGGIAMIAGVHFFDPQYQVWAGIAFLVWSIAVGLHYAIDGDDKDAEA